METMSQMKFINLSQLKKISLNSWKVYIRTTVQKIVIIATADIWEFTTWKSLAEHFISIISPSPYKSPGAGITIPFLQIRKQNLRDTE